MYLSYCAAAFKLKSADINIYTINLVTIFTGTLLVQIGGTLYVSTDIGNPYKMVHNPKYMVPITS